jgi:16S rRNA (guanine527-N7)-methyltransferase
MPKKTLINFAASRGLTLSDKQADTLLNYAQLVWQKKDFLNLTSVAGLREIVTRHLCDGLVAGAEIARLTQGKENPLQLADAGTGAGYIGLTMAVLLPHAQVTLIESLERRCSFLNWVIMQLGLKNVRVKNVRLGQGTQFEFDALTERAMGQLPDILGICTQAVKKRGHFVAFQGENPQLPPNGLGENLILKNDVCYALPQEKEAKRHLLVIEKL